MGLVLTAVFGFAVWIVLWALGAKAFDAFMITTVILVLAAAVRIVSAHLPGNRDV